MQHETGNQQTTPESRGDASSNALVLIVSGLGSFVPLIEM